MKTVAIQGIRGAFHEQAAMEYFNENIEIISSLSFSELVGKVAQKEVHSGVIAIENTVAGTIHQNLELIRSQNVEIIGEIKTRIEQNLAALPGSKLEDIKEVRSHYMAIHQSKIFLDQYPDIKRINDSDTASSLRSISHGKISGVAAIGSKQGAHHYGLEILAEGIETNKQNYTRFLIISNEENECTMFNKASAILKLSHKKGALASLLIDLDKEGINLSKIESFPVIGEPWSYEFLIDLEYEDQLLHAQALNVIDQHAITHRILGKYVAHV